MRLITNGLVKQTNKLGQTDVPLPDCDWSIKMPSIICFGSTSVDIGAAYVNNWER